MFANTPFNYTGSKYKLLEQLIPHFDKTKPYFVDLFAGGGSVYTNVLNFYEKIWVNDIISDLIETHKNLLDSPEFSFRVRNLCVSKEDKERYHKLRDSYNSEPSAEKLFALMLCCTNNMMRFNKSFHFNQTFGERSWNSKTEEKINTWVNQVSPFRNKLHYTSLHFSQVQPKNPAKTFIYADPPYFQTEAGYNAYWSEKDELLLAKYLTNHSKSGGTFCVSGVWGEHKDGVKNSPLLELLVENGFKKMELEFNYEKVSRNKGKTSKEIIIKNYD